QYGMNVANWRMSTPQYYQLLESTGSTGSVCVNYSYARYGTGPTPVVKAAHMAAEWVRYDNGRSKYWEIGNENFGNWESGYEIDVTQNQDGQPRFINGQLYGQHCKVFIDSMRKAAAEIGVEIKIGVVAYDAETSYDPISAIWNEGMMPEVGDLADFLIVHSYFTPHNQDSPASVILNSHDVPSHIMSDIKSDMEEAGKPMIPVALTEWNIFAVRSMQQVSYINGMHAALVLGELVLNDYGMATRWDLTNGWSDGDDHGMFSRGGEPGVDLYNPRPVFFYMYYFQKYFGDRMVSSVVNGNDEIISYASTFSSGETGMVLINKGTSHETAAVSLENIDQGSWYHTMTLTGGDDNGEFSRKVFLNGVGGDEEGGGPDDYESVKAFSSKTRGGIQVELPPYSVVYLMAEKPGPFSYISSRVDDDPQMIHLELSEDVQQVTDPAGFTLLLADGTELVVLSVEQDSLALYKLNLKLDRVITNSDTLTLSYDGTGILSVKDELLLPFSNESVTNALPGDPLSISFHTEYKQTGASLEGCTLRFNGEEGTSDENGLSQFLAQPGDYLVGVEKEHLETITDMALSVYSDTLITLSLDSSSYEVVLQITDIQTGALLSGVIVSSAGQDEVKSSEGMAGFFLFAGGKSFELDYVNYNSELSSAEIVSDTLLSIEMTRSHARVKFRLRNGEQPVNKATVEINGESIVSNQLGQSVFSSLPVSVSLDYKVIREDYETLEGSVELQTDTIIELQMEKIITALDALLPADELFKVYPNPATERIFIESREGDITRIELLDLSGRTILSQKPESTAYSLEITPDVAPGIYMLKAETANVSHFERIVISPSW
ncbi:MAG: T9SS type A sorting domain-containing protein, partial [Bacteroides sp.]|nr:T9SS type A sorting domain-containing protein [Bacteroides sp.]